jgi:uncharacterized membrane protein YfhO
MKYRLREAIIPALITLIIFLGVLTAKGIFPFGAGRIDYYDMGQTNAPLYYQIWDFLHGNTGLFYNWYINQGQNLSMGSSIQWNISVFNLFFLLIPRKLVMQSLSLFMAIHLCFMSLNMDLLLQRVVPDKNNATNTRFCRIIMSVAYGLCGYTLTHYTIPPYLDTAALMPLYLLTLVGVLKEEATSAENSGASAAGRRRVFLYALATGYMTALSYYLAYMNLIFILLISGTYIFLLCPKDKVYRGRVALKLGVGTFSGLGLSAFMLVPAAMQMSRSSRFQSNLEKTPWDTVKEILWAIGADMYYIKWWALAGSISACVAILIGLIRFRKEKKVSLFWFLICFYPCALIPFESINLIIHMGTYYHYPIRCGYWIPLTLLTAGTYYMTRLTEESTGIKHRKAFLPLLIISALVSMIAVLTYYNRHPLWDIKDLFSIWSIFAFLLSAVYASILLMTKDIRCVACVMALELVCGAYIGYGMPHFTDSHASGPEQDGEYVMTSMLLKDELDIGESRTERIKNPDTSLNTNYGMVMDRATVGGWANTMPRPQMDHAGSLGYTLHFMRIMDSGGTLFSDALLHVTQTLTHEQFYCDNEAYQLHSAGAEYSLYDNQYRLPFAMPISSEPVYTEADYDIAKTHNKYFHALSESEKDIIESVGDPVSTPISIVGKKALYLGGGNATQITVNGSIIPIPSLGQPDNTSYPTEFNGALIFAGMYEDQTLEIEGLSGGTAYLLDLDELKFLCDEYDNLPQKITAGKNNLQIEMETPEGKKMALIPMSYDPGLSATVNGSKQEIRNIDDILIGIPIVPGHNTISLSFRPSGMIPGIIISLLTLILLTTVTLSTGLRVPPRLYTCSLVAVRILWLSVLAVLYVIPLAAFLVHQFQKRIL